MNNFLSSTAKKSKEKSIISKGVLTTSDFIKSSPSAAVISLVFRVGTCQIQIPNNGILSVGEDAHEIPQ